MFTCICFMICILAIWTLCIIFLALVDTRNDVLEDAEQEEWLKEYAERKRGMKNAE